MSNLLNGYINGYANFNSYLSDRRQNSCMTGCENQQPPPAQNTVDKKKLKAASIAGSAMGIAAATAYIFASAKKINPSLKYSALSFQEKDALLVGAGSVLGGLTGGFAVDKNKDNRTMKLREASQQFLGNMACPIGCLAATNKLLQKHNVKGILPKAAATVTALVGGMYIGNAVMNKVNDKIFKERVKHDVQAEDYLVHADDLCLTANMLLKDIPSVASVTSKILPASFIVAGSKTGMQTKN